MHNIIKAQINELIVKLGLPVVDLSDYEYADLLELLSTLETVWLGQKLRSHRNVVSLMKCFPAKSHPASCLNNKSDGNGFGI